MAFVALANIVFGEIEDLLENDPVFRDQIEAASSRVAFRKKIVNKLGRPSRHH